MTTSFRIEKDSMGEMKVPASALYGAQTQRAVLNFPISGIRMPRAMIMAMGNIKRAAARVNRALGKLDDERAKAILAACDEVIEGQWDNEFPVDIFQTGSGTSTNMNTNEVIANRAMDILGVDRSTRKIHPNDHVNMGQSSNDSFPTAIHLAILHVLHTQTLPALKKLESTLDQKAKAFDHVVKIGRTHLADATPIRMGQVFSGYTAQVRDAQVRLARSAEGLLELALGGTAVGTGINTSQSFSAKVIHELSSAYGLALKETSNHFAAQAAKDAVVEVSGSLKTTAVALTKVANDIRWLASGPRCGIGELVLPETQPGSSIMPAKVNPVIAESLLMVCARVMGNDLVTTLSGQAGNFELNVMMPVMAHAVIESSTLLATSCLNFEARCVSGIEVDEQRCKELIEQSLAMCTSLAPRIGYDQAAAIAKEAYKTGKTVREVATAKQVLPLDELNRVLDPWSMTEPDADPK